MYWLLTRVTYRVRMSLHFLFFFLFSSHNHISRSIPFIQYPPTAGKVTCRVRLSLHFSFFFLSQISLIDYIPICIPDHWEHPYLRHLCAGINFARATREEYSVREVLSLWALPRTWGCCSGRAFKRRHSNPELSAGQVIWICALSQARWSHLSLLSLLYFLQTRCRLQLLSVYR
jgi:hypothetical protein